MTEKRGVLSRADLVKTLAKPEAAHWLASALCLAKPEYQQVTVEPNTSSTPEFIELGDVVGAGRQAIRAVSPSLINNRPKTHFWYLADRDWDFQNKKQTVHEETPPSLQTEVAFDQDWNNRPSKAPQHIPLLEASALLARLRQFLKQDISSQKVDLEKVVKTISRAEHLSKIPRKNKKQQQRHLHIIDDRSRHLTPYWKDHDLAKLALLQETQGENISFSVLMEGELQPQQLTAQGLEDWQCPPQSLVLVLSDLGALQRYRLRSQNTWKVLGQQLKQKQCTTMALLPCSRQLIAPCLNHLFQKVSWQDESHEISLDDERLLLRYLAPCIRIEPSLIRQVRLKLSLPAGLEAVVWQNPAINSPHSVAASWDNDSRDVHLQSFSALGDAEKTAALSIIREWRQPLDKQVWYEEVTALGEICPQLPLVEADITQAKNYFIALSEQLKDDSVLDEKQHTQAWCRRLLKRLPDRYLNHSPTLQQIAERVHKDTPDYDPRGINPQNLPKSTEPLKQAVLYQRGNALCLKRYEPFKLPEQGYSRLALIDLCHEFVQVTQGSELLGSLKLDDEGEVRLLNKQSLTVKSDQETLSFKTLTAPDNVNIGRDRYGLYADIEFYGVDQRFRYIEPGNFMMGSPEDEKGRYAQFESYQHVTFTEGYWLADTACTQALWEAVTQEKPSEFKNRPENPVENVSWLQVQTFLGKLNAHIPELTVHLPSESQWEYACRAGSTTPFNFQKDIDLGSVNYRGLWEVKKDIRGNDTWHTAAKRNTVSVKSFPANEWGFYEMHGNVLEWCFDEWHESLGNEPVVNPVHALFKSGVKPDKIGNVGSSFKDTRAYISESLENAEDAQAFRVLRGGSWGSSGRYCRSAGRNGLVAGNRSGKVGFRLSLGL